jgi:hypothetical protein
LPVILARPFLKSLEHIPVHAILTDVRLKANQVNGVFVQVKPDNLETERSFTHTSSVTDRMSTIPQPRK